MRYHIRVFTKIAISVLLFVGVVPQAQAQTVHEEFKEIVEATVLEVVSETERPIFGTDTVVEVQDIRAELLSGSRTGEVVVFENEIVPLSVGDTVYLNYLVTINGDEFFMFKDYKRQNHLLWLGVMFVGLLLVFAGRQGALALLSLGLSIVAILFVLVPALLAGYDPALVSLLVAGVILAFVIFITHGVNPRSVIAFGGTFGAVLVTCLVAWFWVSTMRLTGFGDDTAVYLNFTTDGSLDFVGLLLAGIIIGVLGVLDDVSITQASVVQELRRANPQLTVTELYQRAIRVGRDHVGSLVNTLALAYVGVSLPLVLLFAAADSEWYLALNQEIVAAEIVRIIVGSSGLILAVPLTTALAAWYFGQRDVDEKLTASCGHTHVH